MNRYTFDRRGFTILEMLLALAIAGILLSIGVVQLRAPASRLLANDIKAQLEQARYEAIRRNAPVAVIWDSLGQRFVTRLDVSDPRVFVTCAGTTELQVRHLDEYRNVTVVSGGTDAWPGGVVWLPSGQGRACGGGPSFGGTITVTDGRTTRFIDVSVGGRVSIR